VGTYDAGALIDLDRSLRIGIMLPDVTGGFHTVASGINYTIVPSLDAVVDGAYQIQNNYLIVKPGMSWHSHMLQLSGAYGLRLIGQGGTLVTSGFTGGIGLRLASFMLIEYEYQGLTQHRLGLTLRWN